MTENVDNNLLPSLEPYKDPGVLDLVKNDLKDANSESVHFFEVEGAGHSYRVPETKEPIYEDKATELLKNID